MYLLIGTVCQDCMQERSVELHVNEDWGVRMLVNLGHVGGECCAKRSSDGVRAQRVTAGTYPG